MKEAKLYHVGEDGLVEGKALGRLCVYLSADYDQLKAENERLASELRAARVYMESLRLQRELDQARAERAANPFHGMYQDAEGKIPVTAAGQPVGRMETCGEVMIQHLCQHRPTAMFGGTAVSFESPDEYEKWMTGEI